nr:phosphopantetheine-binding protein [Streptomyces anulatus]
MLGQPRIGVDDSFFDLGGDSIIPRRRTTPSPGRCSR